MCKILTPGIYDLFIELIHVVDAYFIFRNFHVLFKCEICQTKFHFVVTIAQVSVQPIVSVGFISHPT